MSDNNSIKSTPNGIQCLNIVNVIAFVINIGVTYVIGVAGGNILGIELNLPNNAELSDKYQTLVTPATYAFSIWAIIFISQFIWILLQFVVGKYRSSPLVTKDSGVGYMYVIVCFAQALWSTLFGLEQILYSLIAMLIILISLLRITFRLESKKEDSSIVDYILLKFPFHIHTGWIIAATLLNINVALVAETQQVTNGEGEAAEDNEDMVNEMISSTTSTIDNLELYVAYGSFVALLLVGSYFLLRKLWVIVFVLIWASLAISIELNEPKYLIIDTFSETEIQTVQYISGGLAIGLLLTSMIFGYCTFKRTSSSSSTGGDSSSSGIRTNSSKRNIKDDDTAANDVDSMLDERIKKYNDDISVRHQQRDDDDSSPTTDYAMM